MKDRTKEHETEKEEEERHQIEMVTNQIDQGRTDRTIKQGS